MSNEIDDLERELKQLKGAYEESHEKQCVLMNRVMKIELRSSKAAKGLYHAKDCVLCWNPMSIYVRVLPLGHEDIKHFKSTTLGVCADVQNMTFEQAKAQCFIEAMQLIVRDSMPHLLVHREMLKVVEYCDGLSGEFFTVEQALLLV